MSVLVDTLVFINNNGFILCQPFLYYGLKEKSFVLLSKLEIISFNTILLVNSVTNLKINTFVSGLLREVLVVV
jgi:hypothetical protein